MRNDLLIHIDSPETGVLRLALTNIANFIAALEGQEWNVVVVANGPALTQFTKSNTEQGPIVASLAKQGVQFQLCNNARKNFNIDESDILEGCTLIPAGMIALVALQNQGFAYVKP